MMTAHPKKSLYPFSRETAGNKRPKRVADMIKNEIGLLLLSKVKDPRLAKVVIVAVEVTRDLRKAIVYYSVLSGADPGRPVATLPRHPTRLHLKPQ